MRRSVVVIASLIAVDAAADVSADAAAKAAALFAQGRAQIEANQVDAACATFDDSLHLDPQIGTRLNLADCRERQGRLDVAYELFVQVAEEGERTGKTGRAGYAREHATGLAAKIVRVTVTVADPPPGLVVQLGTVPIAPGTSRAAMPGKLVVSATAPGAAPATVTRDGIAGTQLAIDVPALVPVVASTPSPPEDQPRVSHRTAYLVGGAGVGLVVVSAVLALHARGRYATAKQAYLDAAIESDQGPLVDLQRAAIADASSAQHEADIATVVGLAGAVAVTVGVVLWLRDKDHPLLVAPTADRGGAGVLVTGRF